MEKIIINEREVLRFRAFMVLESLVMFGLSVYIGRTIYVNFPNWIANDAVMPIKTSVIGILCLFFLLFPFVISRLNRTWMLLLVSALGGIYLSLPMIVWQEKFWFPAAIGLGLFLLSGIIGTIFSRQVKKTGLKKLLIWCLCLVIVAIGLSLGLMAQGAYRPALVPIYGSFSVAAAIVNMYNFAEADDFWSLLTEKYSGRHAEYKFSVLFYLNMLNCFFNIDCARMLIMSYYGLNLRRYISRLKNGVGRESDYIFPKKGIPLLFSQEFSLPDRDIPQIVREKGVKLHFYPYSYVIERRKNDGEIVLRDICGHETELPRTIAVFKPNKIVPEIIINGFGLFIDAQTQESLSEKEKDRVQNIIRHFKKLRAVHPLKSARHELKHYQNAIIFNQAHTDDAALDREFYLRKCFIDEISATCSEQIQEKAHNAEEGRVYVREQFNLWMSNPDRQSYYGPSGDFEHQLGVYQDEKDGKSTDKAREMYLKIFKEFLTFEIGGEKTDLSDAISPDFKLPTTVNMPLRRKTAER